MSTVIELGSIEKMAICEVWPKEDRDFTPWLAENLHELSAELRIELELVDREAFLGSYRLDILARQIPSEAGEISNEGHVVIENQYGNSDHAHLGKLLTYAAESGATKAVWICERFSNEHKKVLNLLNSDPREQTKFYGVEIAVIRIDDSRPALNFDVVVVPDEWHKARPDPSHWRMQVMNREFIKTFDAKLRKLGYDERKGTTNDRSSYRIIGHPESYVRYAAIWHHGKPGFEIVIDRYDLGIDSNREWNLKVFRPLEKDQKQIEKDLKETDEECFEWKPTGRQDGDDKEKQSYIRIHREGDVYGDTGSWDELQDWMICKHRRFEEVLSPTLKRLVS